MLPKRRSERLGAIRRLWLPKTPCAFEINKIRLGYVTLLHGWIPARRSFCGSQEGQGVLVIGGLAARFLCRDPRCPDTFKRQLGSHSEWRRRHQSPALILNSIRKHCKIQNNSFDTGRPPHHSIHNTLRRDPKMRGRSLKC